MEYPFIGKNCTKNCCGVTIHEAVCNMVYFSAVKIPRVRPKEHSESLSSRTALSPGCNKDSLRNNHRRKDVKGTLMSSVH